MSKTVIFRLPKPANLILKGAEVRKTATNEPVFKRYVWEMPNTDLVVQKESKDYHFLLNHPFSKDNEENKERIKNGLPPIFTFYLVDADQAVKDETEKIKTKADAQKKAFTVWEDAEMLDCVGTVCGYIGNDENVKKNIVYKTATDDPQRFISIVEDPELVVRALVKKALRLNVISNKGHYIDFNGQNISNSEAELITYLNGKEEKAATLLKGITNLVQKAQKK